VSVPASTRDVLVEKLLEATAGRVSAR
jgi:hypothetical protein